MVSTTLLSQGCVLENSSYHFQGQSVHSKDREWTRSRFALIQLSGQPVVMSAWFSLLATSLIANPFRVLLTGVSWISWICMSTSLLRFGKILTIISYFFLLLLGFTWCIYGSIWWWPQSALGCLYFSSFVFFSFLLCKKQTNKKKTTFAVECSTPELYPSPKKRLKVLSSSSLD